ncbi:MAG: pilus assembly protein TadB [Actinobacteria bacterium]|nr:pilus assembly protein TadB [Actinomycetota bacterium]
MSFITFIIINVILIAGLILTYKSLKSKKASSQQANSWPEVIDLIVSTLQSGASISESLSMVGKVGPISVRNQFQEFSQKLSSGERFDSALDFLKSKFSDPIADQLFESLYFASAFGSKNTIKILRELSEYVSSDLALRGEIQIRFGWIRNSANLAALAPWLLFLILRSQENAKIAYDQPVGQLIIISGVITTFIAYLWMQKIAKLPSPKRLFTLEIVSNE